MQYVESYWNTIISNPASMQKAHMIINRITDFFSSDTLSDKARSNTRLQKFLYSFSVASGLPGLALLHAYKFKEYGDEKDRDFSLDLLERSVDLLVQVGASDPSLFGGFSGFAWAVEHVNRLLSNRMGENADDLDDEEDLCEDIDSFLVEYLDERPHSGDVELIGGLAGIGVYYLERWPRPSARDGIRKIVEHLADMAVRLPSGITWLKQFGMLSPFDKEAYPEGQYNLGVSHGVPGVIGFLGRVCALGEPIPIARELMEGSVNWLLHQKNSNGGYALGHAIAPNVETSEEGFRPAWCYGNLGVSTALLLAAVNCDRGDWMKESIEIGKAAVAVPKERTDIQDAMICHGFAGNAHLFNRLYQATRDPVFKEAAISWFGDTLDCFDLEHGETGYVFRHTDLENMESVKDVKFVFQEDYGLLEGAVGVALALLAGVGKVEPNWDRLLMSSVSPIAEK